MTVNETYFATERAPGLAVTTYGNGVIAWWQAEILLGLFEHASS